MPITKDSSYGNSTRDIILLFGGENATRVSYLFDDHKKEICKCNIYTGDQDKFMGSYVYWESNTVLAFGQQRLHVFDKMTKKFTGCICYDFEVNGVQTNIDNLLENYDIGKASSEHKNMHIENPESEDNESKSKDEILKNAGNIDDLLM